MYSHFQYCFNI